MRHVLRRREIVVDEWRHYSEEPEAASSDAPLIVPLAELRANAERWAARRAPLGVRLAPADKVEELASELSRFALIAVDFPTPSEGRGYTQGRLLRERLGFSGELRAVGAAVKRDQIFALVRCGFDAFELAPGEDPDAAYQALERYSVAYQPGARGSPPLRQRYSA